jgi:tetratricopeptide (TPR) repeat protein
LSLRLLITLGRKAPDVSDRTLVAAPPAAAWPFVYPLSVDLPPGSVTIEVPDLHEAFINHQAAGTRLVTTQATYLMLAWEDAIGDRDVVMTATADREALERHAPELLARSGLFGEVVIEEPGPSGTAPSPERPREAPAPAAAVRLLQAAVRADNPAERLALCVRALDEARTPAALVATASVCMEVNDLESAARDLDAAIEKAPDWAAAHFERGKLWLRLDDMERASQAFRAAASRMPRFTSAWSNLGATLGELDRPAEALEAFTKALACDPASAQTHNNIGVVSRELGRLVESEAAFRRVLDLVPDLAFGYYNLGHTLFLQGRYQAALGAYAEGQKRDPERNPVQATRLAMCRLATGDARGALEELQRATSALPREYRQQLLADTQSIAWALLTHRPDLAGWQDVHDWLTREQAR